MKHFTFTFLALLLLARCTTQPVVSTSSPSAMAGTWKLIQGTIITKGISAVTDYTKDQEMIKVINQDHFAFLKHPTTSKTDTTNKFDAGGGRYELKGNQYTEHLDFYSDKKFEGTTYHFTVAFKGDTLIQQGKEGKDRSIIEKYLKVK